MRRIKILSLVIVGILFMSFVYVAFDRGIETSDSIGYVKARVGSLEQIYNEVIYHPENYNFSTPLKRKNWLINAHKRIIECRNVCYRYDRNL